jgi:alkylation response protein AidB-like acyl-CoA dehydrogenase
MALKYDDLKFIIEKCIRWDELSAIRSKESSPEDYIMSLKTVAQLCENQVEPAADEIDSEGCHLDVSPDGRRTVCIPEAMKRNLQSLIDLGFFCGSTFPEEDGGFDLPMTSFFAIGELLSMSDGSIGLSPMLQEGCGQVICEYANEAIKKEYLPKLISGERICSMGLTEPGAGSDLAVMQTSAVPAGPNDPSPRAEELRKLGDVYLVSGTKIFITNGFGDVLVLAKTPEGISMFLVYEQDKEVARVEKKLGIKGSPTCEIFFDKSPGVLIGKLGEGLVPNMIKLMHIARLGVATQGLGLAQKAHEMAVNYATNDRVQFGKKIAELSPVRQILFEDEIAIQASRILTYTAAFYFDLLEAAKAAIKKRPSEADDLRKKLQRYQRIAEIYISLAKLDASELSNRVTYNSTQVYGGYGFTKEYPLERLYRDARITSIYEGTSQIQIEQVFNETYYFDKLGLINQYKLGENRSFVENEKNRLFFDGMLNEYRDDIAKRAGGRNKIQGMLRALERMRGRLKEAREHLFVEERKRGKEEGRRFNALNQTYYVELVGDILKGHLLLYQATIADHKYAIAKAYIDRAVIRADYLRSLITSGMEDVINDDYLKVVSA